MKIHLNLLALITCLTPSSLWAADVVPASPTGGVLKMVLGLLLVLAVMAFITWLLKRMMPGAGGQQSVVRVVGGVSVGSRERVVVLEVAGRWLVVGVAPGQVNAIANLDKTGTELLDAIDTNNGMSNTSLPENMTTASFSQWLKKSAVKFNERTNAK